jgi:hypothetical protein
VVIGPATGLTLVVCPAVGPPLDDDPEGDPGEQPARTTTADNRKSPALVRITAVLST